MRLSFSLKNLRRLKSVKPIEIRPITVLLGRNSVGKSTFLRSFPLFRQSIETKSSAPVLWYGDFVDFGDFRSAVADRDSSSVIEFSFTIEDTVIQKTNIERGQIYRPSFRRSKKTLKIDSIKVDFGISSFEDETQKEYINVSLLNEGTEFSIKFSPGGYFCKSISINSFNIIRELDDIRFLFGDGNLFSDFEVYQYTDDNKNKLRYANLNSVIRNHIKKILSKHVDGRISSKTILVESDRILNSKKIDEHTLKDLSRASTKNFRDLYNKMISNEKFELKSKLNNLVQSHKFLEDLSAINNFLNNFFKGVEYIGPARARSERFYRQQELEVSEISPDGKNLAAFLSSLDFHLMENFSEWVKSAFGYGVTVHKTEGHISINLEHEGQSVNVVDTGYGVSQVLPVLAQIWWMQHGRRPLREISEFDESRIRTLAIEQPELHLHPAHQAHLADVFAEAIRRRTSRKDQINHEQYFLIETHSEAMINRLGELIEKGELSEKDVQIIIFGDFSDTDSTIDVKTANFDSDGVLNNWPFGFFNYS